jgi:hypothetical protein
MVVLVRTLREIANHAETVVDDGAHVLAGILTGRSGWAWCYVRSCRRSNPDPRLNPDAAAGASD